jgi:trimeric autotransporter adhesin
MQKVSRSILAGALVLAGLTACGDKITTTPVQSTSATTPVVHSVTVTPASVAMVIGQTGVTLVAQVNADAGLARTVTWASTNAAVATVSSAGVVTAVASGTAVITATSTADPTVAGAASIIVAPVTLASV